MSAAPHPEDVNAGAPLGALARGLALTGGAMLLAISGFVTVSVALRATTGGGVDGDFEIVQVMAAVAAYCLFPLCVATRGNMFVDTFTTMLPRRAQNALDGAWDIVYGAIALVLAWRMALGAQDQFIAKTTLMIRPWPTWGAVAACAALMAALGVVSLAVGFRMIGRKS